MDCLSENVYLTIDVDVLDPSLVSATGTPEPAGLVNDWLDSHARRTRKVIGLDLTKYCYVEGQSESAFLCAKLVLKTLAFVFEKDCARSWMRMPARCPRTADKMSALDSLKSASS